MILVDTSAWIEFLRDTNEDPVPAREVQHDLTRVVDSLGLLRAEYGMNDLVLSIKVCPCVKT